MTTLTKHCLGLDQAAHSSQSHPSRFSSKLENYSKGKNYRERPEVCFQNQWAQLYLAVSVPPHALALASSPLELYFSMSYGPVCAVPTVSHRGCCGWCITCNELFTCIHSPIFLFWKYSSPVGTHGPSEWCALAGQSVAKRVQGYSLPTSLGVRKTVWDGITLS